MDVDIFPTMLKEVSGWTRTLLERHDQRTESVGHALKSIAVASNETRAYVAKIRDNPNAATPDQAAALAKLWTEAGTDIYRVNPQLAERFFMKAEYWSDPVGWERSGRDLVLIDLDTLTESARAALLKL